MNIFGGNSFMNQYNKAKMNQQAQPQGNPQGGGAGKGAKSVLFAFKMVILILFLGVTALQSFLHAVGERDGGDHHSGVALQRHHFRF